MALEADKADRLKAFAAQCQLRHTEIGHIEAQPGIRCRRDDGSIHHTQGRGFDHFLGREQ